MKPIDLSSANVFGLTTLYLIAIVKILEADKLGAALQEINEGTGRLWVLHSDTTVPHAQIAFKFGVDDVVFGVITRDERALNRTVKFAEGIDGFLEELQRFLRANQLAKPKGKLHTV